MKLDKEILHPIHPHHKLKLEFTETPYRCDGCKEAGVGLKYTCTICDFDLHKVCALASTAIRLHFYPKCDFRFHYRPPGNVERLCDACRKDVTGFVYHCRLCGFDLHPCCAGLPARLDDGKKTFFLNMKLAGPCHRCGSKGPGWSYRSQCRSYNLHVGCVKEMLVERWQAMYLNIDKNKMADMFTRIPSVKGDPFSKTKPSNIKRCCEIAGGAVRVVVSAILGDPTAMIAAVVDGLVR